MVLFRPDKCVRERRRGQGGNAIVEFACVMMFLFMPLLFGVTRLGIIMGRYSQAIQVGRDIAHMYSNGVDFTQTGAQNIVTQQLASGVGMTNAGGNGVVILSQIRSVYAVDCTAAGVSPCTNQGLPVFTQRVTIGNTSLRTSAYGTPSSGILSAQGNISATVYLSNSDSSVRTTGFEAALDSAAQRATGTTPTPPAQAQGDTAYVTELYFQYPDIGYLGPSGGVYVSFIFH